MQAVGSAVSIRHWRISDEGARAFFTAEDKEQAEKYARIWLRSGEWGRGGFAVGCNLLEVVQFLCTGKDCEREFSDPNGCYCYDRKDERDEGDYISIDIPSFEPKCFDAGEHQMTTGDDEFGGVRSLGGTAMEYTSYCLKCGGTRKEVVRGTQCNHGEADYVRWRNTLSEDQWIAMRDAAGMTTHVIEVLDTTEDDFPEWWAGVRKSRAVFPEKVRPLIADAYGKVEVDRFDADFCFEWFVSITGWPENGPGPIERRTIEMPGVQEDEDYD